MKYEHDYEYTGIGLVSEFLERRSKQGWELVTVIAAPNDSMRILLFWKRPLA